MFLELSSFMGWLTGQVDTLPLPPHMEFGDDDDTAVDVKGWTSDRSLVVFRWKIFNP
jgi:hypothetical protein